MRAQEFLKLLAETSLFEINMGAKNLRRLSKDINALAGMEFEMIVPNVDAEDQEPEWEADFDQDQRARSFDDVRQFFYDGDYNSRRDVDRLIEELDGEYQEWQMEQTDEAWERDGLRFMIDYISNNELFDRDDAMEKARDEIIDANPDLLDQSPDEFDQLISARVDEMAEEFAQSEFNDQGRIYNDAFEEFTDEQRNEYDERSFLDDKYPYMQDVSSGFDIQWPYYIDLNAESSGGMDIQQVADDFSTAIGRPVNSSSRYHGARREPGKYVVEPDSSLEGDDPGDTGLEFVSPPLPLKELLADLAKVKKWAERAGCYTNDSTGLHINVSVPDMSTAKLDYVKLALLLGDERVLNEFGRLGNTYTKSALRIVKDRIQARPDQAEALLTQMRDNLGALATKVIHTGSTDKYTSINTKDNYVEFRSPGGDWLDANFSIIEPTLLRFVVALDSALDPKKHREEYLKKLYTALAPKGKKDTLGYFAQYVAGEMPKQALKSFIRQAQLERKMSKEPIGGKKYWWNVEWTNGRRMEVVAGSKEVALQVAAEEWDVPESQLTGATVTPMRPYEEPKASSSSASTGNWGIFMTNAGRFARAPGQIDNNVLRRFPSRQAAEQFLVQTRAERSDMRSDVEVREIDPAEPVTGSTLDLQRQRAAQAGRFQEPSSSRGSLVPTGPGPWEIYRISDNSAVRELSNTSRPEAEAEARNALGLRGEAPELYGVRTRHAATQTLTRPGQAQQTFTGEWDVVMGGEVVFRVRGENQGIANQAARQWVLARSPEFLRAHQGEEVEVAPRYAE